MFHNVKLNKLWNNIDWPSKLIEFSASKPSPDEPGSTSAPPPLERCCTWWNCDNNYLCTFFIRFHICHINLSNLKYFVNITWISYRLWYHSSDRYTSLLMIPVRIWKMSFYKKKLITLPIIRRIMFEFQILYSK